MALITCPECSHNVSDKAIACPNCGYPINTPSSTKPRVRGGKPTKLPNGFGTIYKMSGKRSKPYRAVKTDKWVIDPDTGKAKQLRYTIGYYATREEAMIALSEYNKHPYDIKTDSITFSQVYDKWSKQYFETLTNPSSARTITAAYAYCNDLYNMRMKDIKVSHLEGVVINADVGDSTKARIKSLFNMMYKFALAHDIVTKDYASVMFTNGNPIKKSPSKDISIFTTAEISTLWSNVEKVPFVDMILIGIYSGWRPTELALLYCDDIDLLNDTMKGGLKTDAGKNRIVPIHPLIKPLIEKRMQEATLLHSLFLFNDVSSRTGLTMTYDKYSKRFKKAMKQLEMSHKPHETRHTFVSKAKDVNMDEYILKLIVGHNIADITEKVYTHRTIEQLKTEINKITE